MAYRRTLVAAVVLFVALATAVSGQARPTERIVGGQPVAIETMPWMVFLQVERANGDAWSCGGTIVALHVVLTAAHCVTDQGAVVSTNHGRGDHVHGIIGRTNLTQEGGLQFHATRIAVHPKYDAMRPVEGGPYDAALLWTSEDLQQPGLPMATIADAAFYAAGATATIAGWGLTSTAATQTDVLMAASLPIVADQQCADADQVSLKEAQEMICAGVDAGGIDTCQGDSGGPLTVVAGDHLIVAGITSWGYECGAPKRPGLYTRVALLNDWAVPLLAGEEAAWTRATDRTPPKVRQWPARMKANSMVRFSYRVTGELSKTRETITVRRKRTGNVLKKLLTKLEVNPPGTSSFVSWRVPVSFDYGDYVWCITSRDEVGNTSPLTCTAFRI